jgi:lysylphosphatidylglycerol synthetase-like protein (DUF2156 family)
MSSESSSGPRRAGAFDIRLIIALLIGVYGIVLTIMGIGFTTNADLEKAAGREHQPVGWDRHACLRRDLRALGATAADRHHAVRRSGRRAGRIAGYRHTGSISITLGDPVIGAESKRLRTDPPDFA